MQCNPYYGGCPGASNNNCNPRTVWSDTKGSNTSYYISSWLDNGTLNIGSTGNNPTNAFSVRCVLDLNFLETKRNPTDKLCDWNSGYGALQCNYHDTGCKGANADDCYPNYVWSGTLNSGTSYYNRYLNGGTFNSNSNSSTFAFGVRCVLDLKREN